MRCETASYGRAPGARLQEDEALEASGGVRGKRRSLCLGHKGRRRAGERSDGEQPKKGDQTVRLCEHAGRPEHKQKAVSREEGDKQCQK